MLVLLVPRCTRVWASLSGASEYLESFWSSFDNDIEWDWSRSRRHSIFPGGRHFVAVEDRAMLVRRHTQYAYHNREDVHWHSQRRFCLRHSRQVIVLRCRDEISSGLRRLSMDPGDIRQPSRYRMQSSARKERRRRRRRATTTSRTSPIYLHWLWWMIRNEFVCFTR